MTEFRPLRRVSRAITEEATRTLLEKEKRGVLAVNGDNGYPFAFPINYYYDAAKQKIYFHGSKVGHKVDALNRDDKVCFTVYGNETHDIDWAPFVESAVIYGRCKLVTDEKETEIRVREIARKYYPSEEEIEQEIAKDIKAVQLYEISIEHMSGKKIHER